MSGSNKNTECSKETSLDITSTISKDLDACLEVLSDFLGDIKGTCQSTVMGIFNRNGKSTSTSGEGTPQRNTALQNKSDVAKELRDKIDELAPEDLPKLTRTVREAIRDTVADHLADSLLENDDDDDDFEKRIADGQAAVEASLERLKGTIMTSMSAVSSFIPVTTISRHNKWIADKEEFEKLLKRVTDLVALKTCSEIAATTASMESPTSGTRSGSGLSELKLAQARKRQVQDELYDAFGTTHSEQDTTISLVVPSDLAHNFLGLDLLDHILLYVRSRVQIYPIPLVYLHYCRGPAHLTPVK